MRIRIKDRFSFNMSFRQASRFVILLLILFVSKPVFAAYPDSSTVEWIRAYFNMPADYTYAFEGNEARDSWDLVSTLTNRIDSAKYSVDLAIYDLQNLRVAHSLVAAKERGIRVRVATDHGNRTRVPRHNEPMWQTLREGGIISIDDAGTVYWPDGRIEELPQRLPNAGAHMHHKFAVIDAESADPNDHYVWMGSMNLTYTGPWNTNMTMVIKDNEVTAAYLEEFEFLWGSSGPEPNPRRARFHRDKPNVSQNKFWVGDTFVELYFSPMDRNNTKPSISERIVYLIENYAIHDVRFIAFAISPNIPISQSLWRRSATGEIKLGGLIDPSFYGRYVNNNDIWAAPEARMGSRNILAGRGEVRKLHSKTMLIDAANPDTSNHTALTIAGSYNFSQAAENVNDENILIIHCNYITNQFFQDYMGIKSRALGETEAPYPIADPEKWYEDFRIIDAQTIDVEILTGVRHPVSLLGVNAPRIWAGSRDSTNFYAPESRDHIRQLLQGARLRLLSPSGDKPVHQNGRYHAYVLVDNGNEVFHLNRELLLSGHARYSRFYRQHPDSVAAFRNYLDHARENSLGMWEFPDQVGTVIPMPGTGDDLFPININTASARDLEALPTVGPARAQAIIDYRERHGGFNSVEELTEIRGIGPATLERLRPLVVINNDD